MHVLVVPDSFTGTLTASEAAAAISKGWLKSAKSDQVTALAISDGGPGFVSALLTSSKYQEKVLTVTDLIGMPRVIKIAKSGNSFFIESAQIVGSHLVTGEVIKRPGEYTSFGIGEAIRQCVEFGAEQIVVGLGGTGCIDGGSGMLSALGAEPTNELQLGGLHLSKLTQINLSPAKDLVSAVDLVIAADVDVPLLGNRGAALGFGAQKGASESERKELEDSLTHFSSLIPARDDGKDAATMLGAGAAGGIGFGVLALGGRKVSGFDFVADALDLRSQISDSDLVITGEGKFDWQSLQGKAISQLANLALTLGKPTLVLAGQVDVGRREWSALGIVGTYSCTSDGEIPTNPESALIDLAARVARTFSPNSWQN